jgi:hypothetical protein
VTAYDEDMRLWLGLLPFAIACAQPPSFRADRVLPSGAARQAPLAPGMLVSIYGEHLGPATQCIANADTRRTETPNPARPVQSFAERLIYPTDLCGVQVFLAGIPAGLLYISEKQINFKVPQDAPFTGDAELKVLYQQQAGTASVRLGLETTTLSVEGEARVAAPLWIHIEAPFGWSSLVQYPVGARPNDFGCNELELRRNGVALPRIALRPPSGGIAGGGLMCGNIGIEGGPLHTGRLPLHLLYRFTEAGVYEVRYTRRGMDPRDPSKIQLQSEWTPIQVLPRAPGPRVARPAPTAPAELLSDYLPGLLGFSDPAALDAVVACLYHPNYTVRTYASAALAYWPQSEADARVDRELSSRGPSDMTVEGTLQRHPGMLALVLPYLKSDDPALLRGALTGVARWVYAHPADAQAETALIAAAEHVIAAGDEQTVINYAAALGTVRDPRAGTLLWNLVQRNVAREQALIAISWRKDPRDLPRLAALLESPAAGDPLSYKLASLPYALRNSFGDAALPYLESALKNSDFVWVRTNCARELILAGRPSGFAFAAQAIEQKTRYVREMVQFVQDRFPELRGRDDAAVLAFLRAR